MEIILEYVAMLKIDGPPSGSAMTVPEGTTAGLLMHRLGLSPSHQNVVVPFVNDTKVRPETELKPGDRIFLAMPVGGG